VRLHAKRQRQVVEHSAGAQPVASWAPYDSPMTHEVDPAGEPVIRPTPCRPTFLGSGTAPDEVQVRRRLHEIRATSRRRKTYATCAVAAGTLFAVAVAQHAALHAGSGAH
jgi:hypothetical protein